MSAVVASFVVAGVALVGQYQSGQSAKKAAKAQAQAQKEGIDAQGRSAESEAQRARVSQNREARIRRAQVLASTGTVGAGSSGVAGATSSIGAQAASNIGFINQTQTFAQEAGAANQRAADAGSAMATAQAKGQQWAAVGSLATTFATSETNPFKTG